MNRIWPALALIAAIAIPAVAQEEPPVTELYGPSDSNNPWEFILGGSGSNDKDFDTGGFNVNAELGYYFTPELYVAVRQGLGFTDFGDSSWSGSTTGAFDYHFNFDRLRPFVGVGAGFLYGDDVDESFIAGPEFGVKYYVKNDTFLYARGAYEFIFEDTDDADEAFDDGRFVYALGIGFNF